MCIECLNLNEKGNVSHKIKPVNNSDEKSDIESKMEPIIKINKCGEIIRDKNFEGEKIVLGGDYPVFTPPNQR